MSRLLAVTCCYLWLIHGLPDQVQATRTQGRGVVKKCCPINQSLTHGNNSDLVCVPMTSQETAWSWLPGHELLDEAFLNQTEVLHGFPDCPVDSRDFLFHSRHLPSDEPAEEFALTVNSTDFLMSVKKFDSRHHEDVEHPTNFNASTFCVDIGIDDYYIAFICPCGAVPCVRKCCADGSALQLKENNDMKCVNVSDTKTKYWVPVLENTTPKEDMAPDLVYYRLTDKAPLCESEHRAFLELKSPGNKTVSRNLTLLSNFSLQTLDKERVFPADDYCADFTEKYGEIVHYCSHPDMTQVYWYRFYGILFLLGAAALLLTIILTGWLPELRQTLHQRMALAHNVMLFIGNATVGIGQWSTGLPLYSCKAMSFVIQITLLATFFWLNSMCIDITWVFSGLQQNRSSARSTTRKFMWFALYSWGSTCLISCIMAVFEFSPSITVLKPKFGEGRCFFNDRGAQWLFLYGPIALILIINCVMFVYTAAKIMIVKRQTAILNEADSNTNTRNRKNFLIFMKLFCLMGLTWVTEIMGLLLGGSVWAWVFTDIINLLQGVFIFLIFCCNRTVYNLVRGKLRRFATKVGIDVAEESKSTTTKSSSMELENIHTVANTPACNRLHDTAAALPVAATGVASDTDH